MTKPNIFKFATSELSQDAFICYVLDYYKDEYIDKYPLEYSLNKIKKKIFIIKYYIRVSTYI